MKETISSELLKQTQEKIKEILDSKISPNNIVCTQFKIKRNEELFFDESDERLELPYYSNKEMHSYFLFSLDTNKGNFEGLDMNYYYLLKKWKQLMMVRNIYMMIY